MPKNRNQAIDILRIFSIFAVILIHTSTRTLEIVGFDLGRYWWTFFLNQAFRFAVPLFFMLSGYVLELNYSGSSGFLSYLKKRTGRILIPYVFWSAVYYFLVYTSHSVGFLGVLPTGSASHQLYFIPSLLIFYLLFPLIHRILGFLSRKWILLPLALIQIAILYYDYYYHPLPFYHPVSVVLMNYFVFLLGAVYTRYEKEITDFIGRRKYTFLAIVLILFFFIPWEGAWLYSRDHNYLKFYSSWRPAVFIYTLSFAGFMYYIFSRFQSYPRIVAHLSHLSFLVFFTHIIWLELIWKYLSRPLFDLFGNSVALCLLYDPLYFTLTALASFLTAWVIHRLPHVSRIMG